MKHINTLIALAMLMFSAHAQALTITPSTTNLDPTDCTLPDCNTAWTSTNTINTYIEDTYGVTELYKSDVIKDVNGFETIGTGEEGGAYDSSYNTEFTGTAVTGGEDDVSGATITWDSLGGDTFDCPTCLLLVKDGNLDPNWYLFDLGNWDGMEDLILSGFWADPTQGNISHISIFSNNVPEPGMIGLLAIGLLGMVVARRRMKL